jgi:hypothetical protein
MANVRSNELDAHSAHAEHDHRRNEPGDDRAANHEPVGDAIELALIGVYVFLAQQDRRPCNVTYLSRKTGLSRATVRRRAAHLVELGYVESSSRRYLMGPGFAKRPGGRRIVQTHVAAINSAARKLANLAANQNNPR